MCRNDITDLHTHILPSIDDGAKDIQTSLELLRKEQADGVTCIALTPHFNCERQSVEEFLAGREEAYRQLSAALPEDTLQFKLGAEVYFSPQVLQLDLDRLCMQDTSYLLVELPVSHYPSWTREVFYQIQLEGITPILAHVERYGYILKNPGILYDLVAAGALAQVNAESLLKAGARKKMIHKFIRWNLVHLIASDTHSTTRRPPLLGDALARLKSEVRTERFDVLCKNAQDVFAGKDIEVDTPHQPKQFLNCWI